MKVYIDADGCCVVSIVVNLCKEYCIPCVIVSDFSHEFSKYDVEHIRVSKGKDSADFKIISLVEINDIIVTQDYGLAALGLSKHAKVIRFDGFEFNNDNIDALLLTRHTTQKLRKSNIKTKGPSKRTPKDDYKFTRAFKNLLKIKT